MFRDPSLYVAFREKVVPALRTYPFTRIWCAGCSTGEEVYSLAILPREGGLYDRTRIYATDINEHVLATAREGVLPLERMQQYTQNYLRAGGKGDFSEYYVAAYDNVRFMRELTENVVFAQHNLAMDRSFNEFNVILCRNVMIYFDKALQNRVHRLFYESLDTFGILVLGHKESLAFSPFTEKYEAVDEAERIYRKIACRVRDHRDRHFLGRAGRREPAARRHAPGRPPTDHRGAAPRHRRRSGHARAPTPGPHTPARVRPRRQDSPRGRPRLSRAARLPPARGGRPPRAVNRCAGAVRAAIDRRALRLGRRCIRPARRRRRAHWSEQRRRGRARADQRPRRCRDRAGSGDLRATCDAGRRHRRDRCRRDPPARRDRTLPLWAVRGMSVPEANILLVDDRPENLLAVEAILEPLGHRLVSVTSATEALKELLRESFACILLDVQMPDLDGYELAELIKSRERTQHIPIIFVTALSKEQRNVYRGYSAGAVDYIFKPIDPDILRSKVSVFVDLWQKGEQLREQAALLHAQQLSALEERSEERYNHLADAMPQIVWTTDAVGGPTSVNC